MLARRFSITLIFALVSVVAACGSAPPPPPPPPPPVQGPSFVGRWIGAGQPNMPLVEGEGRWDMVAVIAHTDGAQCGTIDYSTLGCSGIWHCQANDGNTLSIREEIRVRGDRCYDGGQIEMSFDGNDPDLVHWRYHGANGLEVHAELRRQPDYR